MALNKEDQKKLADLRARAANQELSQAEKEEVKRLEKKESEG